ncbi:MAG: FAD-binding oxidoreductase [Deltaproteobacteria bacterium]|nr:FAD-binding oxidoreductase [Deltaproteobacteria bacterium]
MPLDVKLRRELEAVVGKAWLSADPADQLAYSRDLWPKSLLWLRAGRHTVHPPQAVVWPGSVAEVQAVVRLLVRHGVPLVPFGAGSGVCGGTLPLHGDVLVDLKRLSRLRSVDPERRLADVEAGVLGEDLEQALLRRGFTCGHFPSSMYCSSVGGWLATRGAGQMSTLYGKIEDMVSELGIVTGDGAYHVVPGRPGRGRGPGFCQLLVGSEGSFGIVTDARLRLHPAAEARRFRALRFSSLKHGIDAVRRLLQAGLRPAVVRLYDAIDSVILRMGAVEGEAAPVGSVAARLKAAGKALVHGVKQRATRKLLERPAYPNAALDRLPDVLLGGCVLVLVFEGRAGLAEAEERLTLDLLADTATDLGEPLARRWYEHRYAISYHQSGVFDAGGFTDTMEVAATWDRLFAVYVAVRRALRHKVLVLAHFSHAYHEGCSIYFTFVGPAETGERGVDRYDETWRTALGAVVEAGGVISHHHGVGVSKAAAMEGEYGHALRIAWALKRTFDPAGVLNPGKLIGSREKGVTPPPAAPGFAGRSERRGRGHDPAEAVRQALEEALPGGVEATGDPPVFTVTPGDVQEVAAVLRLGTERRIPVLARSEAPTSRPPAAAMTMRLSLERLQAIRQLSEEALVVHAEAGVRVRTLEQRLGEHALSLGYALLPDVSPKLGGLLGGRGWGEASVLQGSFDDACIGLEAVLPRGEPIRIKAAPRRAAGPDLMQAFVAGEGAFGVITAAYLRVYRPPKTRQLVAAWFPGPAPALACLAALLADSVRPAAARVVRPGPAWATSPMRGEAVLVLAFEGYGTLVEAFVRLARDRIAATGGATAGEDEPLCVRGPLDLPADAARPLERVEAAGRWTELCALDLEAQAILGEDLVACRWSNALPEGGTACWTVLAPEGRIADVRRPAFRLVERFAHAGVVLSSCRGTRPLPAVLGRAAHGPLHPWMEALKRELDPAGIMNPGALGL